MIVCPSSERNEAKSREELTTPQGKMKRLYVRITSSIYKKTEVTAGLKDRSKISSKNYDKFIRTLL